MELKVVGLRPQVSNAWIKMERIPRKPSGSLRLLGKMRDQKRLMVLISARQRHISLEVSCSNSSFPAPLSESGSTNGAFDEWIGLQNKKWQEEIEPCLNGRCIYLVGMMGSGKTTMGKVLSQVLGYSFCDSDSLIEEDMNGTPVSDIFKFYGEGFFRDKETEMLRRLSIMHRIVVSTGGGAVVRPINWKYMQKGISVWIDVPLEALAQRISAVGTESRPLLHVTSSSDEYTSTYRRLSTHLEDRSEAYANANARVSLDNIAAKMACKDLCLLSPTAIAIEALDQIENYLRNEEGEMAFRTLL